MPQKGEFGYETWPEKDHEKFGGVHNWSESTMDPETGIIYIPTGTARFDFYGGNREGDNLFANSIVALDARTGERKWHFQTIHHDLWDFDIPQAPKLLTIHKDGKDIPVVIQATKQGFVFVFNRLTGEPIWPIEERPVPASDVPGEKASPTQPFPTWPKPFARQSFTEDEINPYLNEADKAKLHELFKTARNEGLYTRRACRARSRCRATTVARTGALRRSIRSRAASSSSPSSCRPSTSSPCRTGAAARARTGEHAQWRGRCTPYPRASTSCCSRRRPVGDGAAVVADHRL